MYLLVTNPYIAIFISFFCIFRDARLTFGEHLKVSTTKVNKTVELLRKLAKKFAKTGINDYIQRFCESTSRYGDVIYDETLQRNISPET